MLKIKILISIWIIVFCVSIPLNALACACCSEPGTYSIRTGKAESFELSVLNDVRFDSAAALYMTEAGFDGIKGLGELEKDFESESWTAAPADFNLLNTFAAKTWKFTFKTPTGKAGTLILPMPAQMLKFNVDIHDDSDSGAGPSLYKEWRFKGNVSSGTGIFKSSIIRPTTYFLVLQGRGNNCDDAANFTHWHLEINGKRADYEFFGKLSSGTGEANGN
jgi:hypothetical protein